MFGSLAILVSLKVLGIMMHTERLQVTHALDIRPEFRRGDFSLALTSDGGSCFVANDKDRHILEFDTDTGKLRKRIETELSGIECIRISQDAKMLAAGGDGLVVIERKNGGILFHKKVAWAPCVAFSPNSKYLTFGTSNRVGVLTLSDGREWDSIKSSRGSVLSVAFSPNGANCAFGGIDEVVHIWDIEKKKEKRTIDAPVSVTSALAYSQDGHYLAFSGVQHNSPVVDPLRLSAANEIRIWDLEGNRLGSVLTGNMTRIKSLVLAKRAQYVLASAENGVSCLWQRHPNKTEYSAIWSNARCKVLAVSTDFAKMVTASSDGSVSVWSLRAPKGN